MKRSHRKLVFVALITIAAGPAVAVAQEAGAWSQFRPVAAGEALPSDEFGLTLAWSRDLGFGYSNVSLADGKVVTMFTSGEVDVIGAFDLGTGEEVWRYQLGEKYAGHDGSTDGPLSTPAIVGDTVYALGPFGRLVALALGDGSERWRREIHQEGSTPPFYGYTSSPLPAGDLLILATGGEGRAITAFDRATGEPRWQAGDDSISYQTPVLMELGGETTVVGVTDHLVLGLDPASGEIRFELRHTEGERNEESAHVTPIDGERFLVNYDGGATMYRLGEGGLETLWETNAFANSLAIPVRVDEHLYGFTGRFLTCASVATGEIVWRSRPPRARGLSRIGDTLAVAAADGDLVLVAASPEGYREIARHGALEAGDYATPSFAGGHFVVRDLGRIAAVRVDRSVAPLRAERDPLSVLGGELGAWVRSLIDVDEGERRAAVEERFAGVERTPILEDGGVVQFVWRGAAEDVGLEGDEFAQRADNGLFHLSGTDLFVRTEELDPRGQFTYAFSVDYGQPSPDPGNPYAVDNGANVVSELRMPGWPASPHLEPPADDAPRGELDSFPFRSEILDNTRQIQVWRPPGYGRDPEQRYPVLVVNHGDNLLRGGLMRNTLDNLVGDTVAPLIAVFVPRQSPVEYGGEQVDKYLQFLDQELLPHLDRHYLTTGGERAIMGPGSAGVTAVYAALERPDLFQRAAVQSFYPIEPAHERLPQMAAEKGPKPDGIYVVWSRNDYDLDEERRADEASQALLGWLRAGGIEVTEQVTDYSPGWGGWRGQHDEILAALFPAEAEAGEEASSGSMP